MAISTQYGALAVLSSRCKQCEEFKSFELYNSSLSVTAFDAYENGTEHPDTTSKVIIAEKLDK